MLSIAHCEHHIPHTSPKILMWIVVHLDLDIIYHGCIRSTTYSSDDGYPDDSREKWDERLSLKNNRLMKIFRFNLKYWLYAQRLACNRVFFHFAKNEWESWSTPTALCDHNRLVYWNMHRKYRWNVRTWRIYSIYWFIVQYSKLNGQKMITLCFHTYLSALESLLRYSLR